jgi:hypothetical protein
LEKAVSLESVQAGEDVKIHFIRWISVFEVSSRHADPLRFKSCLFLKA